MRMLWNGRCKAVGGERLIGASVRVLGAATIAAVAASCASMRAQSEPDMPDAVIPSAEETTNSPPVRSLGSTLREGIADHASEIYRDLPGFQRESIQNVYAIVSYIDAADGQEKLLSLATRLPDPDEEVELKEGQVGELLRIPESQDGYTTRYRHLIFVLTASPDQQTPCGQSGGTNYCNF